MVLPGIFEVQSCSVESNRQTRRERKQTHTNRPRSAAADISGTCAPPLLGVLLTFFHFAVVCTLLLSYFVFCRIPPYISCRRPFRSRFRRLFAAVGRFYSGLFFGRSPPLTRQMVAPRHRSSAGRSFVFHFFRRSLPAIGRLCSRVIGDRSPPSIFRRESSSHEYRPPSIGRENGRQHTVAKKSFWLLTP